MMVEPQDLEYGGPEWSEQLKSAIREAVAEHQRRGNPVYFTDAGGDICELSPDRKTRKLTHEEVDQLISASDPS